MNSSGPWHVYILRCADGSYYIGVASDVPSRVRNHNDGRGASYTFKRRPVILVFAEPHATELAARRRERQLKGRTGASSSSSCLRVPSACPSSSRASTGRATRTALVPLPENRLRSIFAEAGDDFSAEICPGATLAHIDAAAIEYLRRRWRDRSGNARLARMKPDQLLRDAGLLVDGGLTYAALILCGTRAAVGRLLAQAEVIVEYGMTEAPGPANVRHEYRQGFFTYFDEVWRAVALRNDVQHHSDGPYVLDIPTFEEGPVREALLNAVGHRDYRLGGCIFVRQYLRRIVFESPGGLPHGITTDNILDRQSPRNRLIAEVLAKCGLVERAGQGMDLMFERSIRLGKRPPDFTHTDAYGVFLTLDGEVWDPRFVRFLRRAGEAIKATLDTHDLLVADLVHRQEPVPSELHATRKRLFDLGILERVGRGSAVPPEPALLWGHRSAWGLHATTGSRPRGAQGAPREAPGRGRCGRLSQVRAGPGRIGGATLYMDVSRGTMGALADLDAELGITVYPPDAARSRRKRIGR